MNKNVRSVIWVGVALVVFMAIMFLSNRQFHNEAFSGTVVTSYWRKNSFVIETNNSARAFDVHPVAGVPPINKIVAKGDSLFKKQFTDTVILVHQNHVFKYTLDRVIPF